ncbi:LLM class flavin-dependent oxidoreductase [Corynebacterium suicordis]
MTTDDLTFHWYLPSYGDSRNVSGGGHGAGFHQTTREPTLDYLTQLVRAAEYNGFDSILTPIGQWCADPLVTTAALIGVTSKLKFLLAFRPGLLSSTLLAQQAQAFQKLSGNRLYLNTVVGGEDAEQRSYGDSADKNQRYDRADEVLDFLDQLWDATEPLDYQGEYVQAEQAQLPEPLEVKPEIFFGGSSQKGLEVAARRASVYLTWGEPPEQAGEKIRRVEAIAENIAEGRTLEYGIRLHVIARQTSEEAWAEAQRLLNSFSTEEVAKAQQGLARSQSEGQKRMNDLHGGDFETGADARDFEVYPGLWAGVGLVRGGAGTALVGSYEEVAALIAEYKEQGFKHFVLSGYPHLEETFTVGEGVIPALKSRGLTVTNH